MTSILASEPITVKRIIFRIQSKNFSELQFTLSCFFLSLLSSFPVLCICLGRSKRKITIKRTSREIAHVIFFSSFVCIKQAFFYYWLRQQGSVCRNPKVKTWRSNISSYLRPGFYKTMLIPGYMYYCQP